VKLLETLFHTPDSDHYNEIASWNPLYKKDHFLGNFLPPFGLAPVPVLANAIRK
jgi:hypothetical protein